MKIGIITITQGTNYGNRLQIYALQHVIEQFGHKSYLILNNSGINSTKFKIKKCGKIILNYKGERREYKREKSFQEFDHRYLCIDPQALDENYSKTMIGEKYDAFICGSDQLWNPQIPYMNGIMFAAFDKVKKRISYAASFGISELPVHVREKYKEYLEAFDSISVRETTGAHIVEELIRIKPNIVADPTMLLTSEEWEKIEENPSLTKNKYIVLYFLGEIDARILYGVKKFRALGYEIVNIFDKNNKIYTRIKPTNFVYLIHHAEMIITDSYHAVVFSLLFKKRFYVFDRCTKELDMSSRIDTLIEYFGLGTSRNVYSLDSEIQYTEEIDDRINLLKSKGINYLNQALQE